VPIGVNLRAYHHEEHEVFIWVFLHVSETAPCVRAVVRGELINLLKLMRMGNGYKQVGGLGKPANLQAYFKGPSGNNLCR